MTDGIPFNGFPKQTRQFYADLTRNNNRGWFQDHKIDYESYVLAPAQAFVAALGERLQSLAPGIRYDTRTNGSGSIMRIYRDVRFSKDKTPYKTNLGLVFWEGEGKKTMLPAFYFGLEVDGARLYAGLYSFDNTVLSAYRAAVMDETSGSELALSIADITAREGFEVRGEHYKRVPRGFDPDHPRADLLRYKGLGVVSPHIPSAQVESPNLVEVCLDHARTMVPVQQWLVKMMQQGVGV